MITGETSSGYGSGIISSPSIGIEEKPFREMPYRVFYEMSTQPGRRD